MSGGRVVAGSNPVIPTLTIRDLRQNASDARRNCN
jgi:hypothetical protein